MTFAKRAKKLRDDPSQWGEHMDFIAAAWYFKVNFNIFTKGVVNGKYVEEIWALTSDGKRLSSTKQATRVYNLGYKLLYY
jgi:hypothetical protein